jgi:inorganic triphosphatase YgiF
LIRSNAELAKAMKLSSAETELKLALAPSVAESVLTVPVLTRNRAGKPKSRRLVSTYYDTPEKDLARRGVTLRVRQADDERIQTLKSAGGSGVANSRGEWEWPVERSTPDLGLLKDAAIANLLADVSEDRLEPILVTDVVRTTQDLEVDGDLVEAALDLGSIVAGEAKQDIGELELELRQGTPGSLYRLALELNSAVPFDIEVESKAARGFRLKEGLPPQASKPSPIRLKSDDTAIEALGAIMRETLGHLLTNQPAALAGDPEGVHQVRIAVRRSRSALRLFSPHLEQHATRLFEDELRRAGRTIGEARDWDVFCDEILAQVSETAEARKCAAMIRAPAEARRASAHERCERQLQDPSFRALVLGLAAWIEEGRKNSDQVGDKALKRDIKDIAEKLLDGLDAKAMKRGRAVRPDAEAAELHPLRKSLKKLRYSVEFLQSIYRPKKAKRFLRRLKKLQDALGEINDAAMATRLAESLAADKHLELAPSVAALSLDRGRAARGAMKALAKSWQAYCDEPRFWKRA